MLSTEEQVAVLHSVNLFLGTSDDQLASVTKILTEADFPANTVIFEKNDPGDCMYIVIDGRLRVHDGERTLNYLTTRDIFGEMALLDAQPRTATVTTIEDSRLLRIDHEPFYDLLAALPEVGRGVIRVLSQRLRARVLDMHEDFMYIQAMNAVTNAAVALESGNYQPGSLEEVKQRDDSLGHLARVFEKMATEVQNREQRLKEEVHELRVQIDESKKQRDISEIVDSAYFQDLQAKIKTMKNRK